MLFFQTTSIKSKGKSKTGSSLLFMSQIFVHRGKCLRKSKSFNCTCTWTNKSLLSLNQLRYFSKSEIEIYFYSEIIKNRRSRRKIRDFLPRSRVKAEIPSRMSFIQGVSGGIVNILGGGSMDYSE
jgi:hypothetical protein